MTWRIPDVEESFSNFLSVITMETKLAGEAKKRINLATGRDFTCFDYMAINENTFSDIIANLLSPQGSHGQGDLFLSCFLRQCGREHLIGKECVVKREVCTNNIDASKRRIDIVVWGKSWVIGMEVKIYASEQANQLHDYYRYLTTFYDEEASLLFLTPTGRQGLSGKQALCVSFHADTSAGYSLEGWLNDCIAVCQAEKVRWFLKDFREYLKKL